MPHSTPPPTQMPSLYPLHPPPAITKAMKQGFSPLPVPPLERETRTRKQGLLRPHHRTNPLIWCGAIVCVMFSLLVIFAGIITLVIFLVIKPRNPSFDAANASLNSVYLDAPFYLNGDLTFLANFSNPNQKIDIMFEYISIELYFYNRLLATQALETFAQRRGEARLEAVHMISSEVYLSPELALELQRQVRTNRIVFNIRATFKVKASLGVAHYSYWLYARCVVELTGPPSGVLVARGCRTKR